VSDGGLQGCARVYWRLHLPVDEVWRQEPVAERRDVPQVDGRLDVDTAHRRDSPHFTAAQLVALCRY